MVFHGQAVRRDLIPSYFTGPLALYLSWWQRWKTLGWPYAGGWAEQPGIYVDVIEACEAASAAWRQRTQETSGG